MDRAETDATDSLGPNPREQKIGELLNSFFDRRDGGEVLTEAQFLGEHPDYADDLREHFSSLNLIQGLGSAPSSERTLPVGAAPANEGSSGATGLKNTGQPLPEIPGYDVLKQIGRGGMGVVYKAVQRSTKRVVALKALLEGPFASDVARARFEREIALAAALKHPGIIPIYDSGVADGRMYYAMEHVYGLPLSDHVRTHEPSIPAKLKLFMKICDAVGHAHQRGVIHRDLKPANILVDGDGEPHVLDFGLARAGSLPDANISMTAQIVGTPAYMSPEQAGGDPGGIDTRTDVYSLGVVLYEMLTGQMPYETTGAMGRILNQIAQAEPEPPGRINKAIDGDLSAIALKALEKAKEDRYQSIQGLQEDVGHYLQDEPISAKPPTGFYLLRKVARKHRRAIAVVVALLAVATAAGFVIKGSIKKSQVVRQLEERVRGKDVELEGLKEERAALTDERDNVIRESDKAISILVAQTFPNLSPASQEAIVEAFRSATGQGDRRTRLLRMLSNLGAFGSSAPGSKSKLDSLGILDPDDAESSDVGDFGEADRGDESDDTLDDILRALGLLSQMPDSPAATQPASRPDDGAAADPGDPAPDSAPTPTGQS